MARDIENKEWLNDYAQLKQVSTKTPFTVPDGYFDGLTARITSAIKLDELKVSFSSDCFTVPENYFEKLSSNIQSRIVVENFLATADTGLTVPENYFEQLSGNIQSRVVIEDLINTEHHGLTVPENYFEGLSTRIQSRLVIEEALGSAANTFTVPQDYFKRLNKNILNKTANQDVVKRKSMVIRMISSRTFKYATAACFLLMIGTRVFLQIESPEAIHDRSFLHKELSTVPVSDIQNYLEQNVDGGDTQHTITSENLPVSAVDLKAALQDYTDQ